ncbi:Uncharacterized conserved protein, DUF2147 family [Loktanella fryxellensis]|uniref:Uncharacterized conserved protein, DUF2147 family n=1 Tax=Loktanella fryxellensis TaxID=245187 RepID=A0A1H7Z8A0_9RHOB|nr:DUF2147 domain-containing protein [Loktanella fryxellensis]SEM54234.1 Uncharacterized conserved protein, DUF2147 family [Loktanella fryxellensis]
MTTLKRLCAALLVSVAATTASAQDAAIGTWQTEVDDGAFGYVAMTQCGAAVCGTIQQTYNADGTPLASENIGRQIVINMAPAGDGTYAGQVYRPSNGKTYNGKMQVEGNALRLQGCVAGGLLCASQNWARVQ